jgi:hypothetical protein
MERRVESRVLRDVLVIVVIAMVPFQILDLRVIADGILSKYESCR